jgi:hypothetical protein
MVPGTISMGVGMTLDDFKATLGAAAPPAVASALLALWHEARGDWDAAHRIAQDVDDATGAWVHAYLHRREGDPGNAAYWYSRARRPVATGDLQEEWEQIAAALLAS